MKLSRPKSKLYHNSKTNSNSLQHTTMKILDIQKIRFLTRLLGKLGLNTCRTHNPQPPHPWGYSDNYKEWSYGWGLKETKDYVEAKYEYEVES